MIRALLIDIDNTLVDRDSAFRDYAGELVGRMRPDASSAEQRELIAAMVREDDSGYRPRIEFATWLAGRLPMCGWSAEMFRRDQLQRLPEQVRPAPAMNRLLAELQSDYRVALVSNGGSDTQRRKLAGAGLSVPPECVFISGELGVAKPDPELFRRALDHLNCGAEEAVMLGDDPRSDIQGGQRAGLRTCWLRRDRRWRLPARPDWTIEDLSELRKCLR